MKKTFRNSPVRVAELIALDKSDIHHDGGPEFNRLIFSKSPYLLQHAENPVDWYEWGEDAFLKARNENLPVLLSIGYSTCHWCHVMAHESFEDTEVAALLNRHFVCIKVDREERPDIDDFYMTAAQLLSGGGGWPLNIFMAPDRRPFMAITYLPKRGRNGMSGLMELLANIATLWRQRPDMIEINCRGIMEELANLRERGRKGSDKSVAAVSATAFSQLSNAYDREYGGFGSAPKFPMPIYLRWLIVNRNDGSQSTLDMALTTLRRMRSGGIWDQLAGGLHRYSVDRFWLVPHFEKMLYDQAMFAHVALDAVQATGDSWFGTLAEEIIVFIDQDLRSSDGAFYSAIDADSEGVEGKFYLWNKAEIVACLGDDADLFCDYFDVTGAGNFEGETILNIPRNLSAFCERRGIEIAEAAKNIEECRNKLLLRRIKRIRPLTDTKIITSWNGLMIGALARAGIICDKPEYIRSAEKCADFIRNNLRRQDGRLLRSHVGDQSSIPAFLEDYTFLAIGFLELFESSLNKFWLTEAEFLGDEIIRQFRDPATGEFFLTGQDAEQMPVRITVDHDGVTPSAISSTAMLFLRLGLTCSRDDLISLARGIFDCYRSEMERNPLSQLGLLQVATLLDSEPCRAMFYGNSLDPAHYHLLKELKQHLIPALVITVDKSDNNGPPRVSICADGVCHPVVASPDELATLLRAIGVVSLRS
ncbi:MAG TPA: thioredoxin domain-containing protein [Desulfuromonadales bacterium]|nr:thioredoxin domain-containing protein [Desulfuromonadales bacterium]